MRITFELDQEHAEKLKTLEKGYNKNAAEITAFFVDEVFNRYLAMADQQKSGQLNQQHCSD